MKNPIAGTTPDRPDVPGALILATVCLCQLMVVLDTSVVNVALVSIDHALGFSDGALSWVVNAYTLAFGGLLLLGGRISDFIGHRRALLWGLGLFALASLLGGLAQGPSQLIAARVGQGVAAALLAPVSLTVIMVTFPEGPQRRRAIGLWAMVAALGSALGVLLGGVLTDLFSWRWVLFINLPIVAVAIPLGWRTIHDNRRLNSGPLDVGGAGLATAASASLVYAMVRAGEHGWADPITLGLIAASVAAWLLFAWWELRVAAAPLVRLGIFTQRTVWVANVVVVFIGAASIAGFYFASLFLQNVLGYSPLQAGVAFLPFCLGVVAGAMLSGRIVTAIGYRWTISLGLVLGAVGMLGFSLLDADSTFISGFMVPSIIASIGIGSCMVTNTSMGASGASPEESGLVSGLLNTSRQLGGSVALAALATLAAHAATASGAADAVGAQVAGYQHAYVATAILLGIAALIAAAFVPHEHAWSTRHPSQQSDAGSAVSP